ncbi:MAG: Wzz/FepE/Etk N-terminal domain-containing protein [Gemmatimonadales bacterium]
MSQTAGAPPPSAREVDRWAGPALAEGEQDVSLVRLLIPLVRRWQLIAACALVALLGSVALAFLLPVRYTAETTFTADQSQSSISLPSGLAGLAGQFGFSLEGLRQGLSPEFFVSVLQSRAILVEVLQTAFPDSVGGRVEQRKLIDILDVQAPTPAKRLEKSLKQLRKRVSAAHDRKSGILSVAVEDASAPRAAAITNHILELLNRYNVERLQTKSRQQREFAEQRLEQAQGELRTAEQAQLRFLQTNRQYNQSPLLAYEAGRLQRTVQLKQDVVTTLTKAYEEARISEARSIPALVVVDPAETPAFKSSPKRAIIVTAGLLLGLALGVVVALALGDDSGGSRPRDPDRAALASAVAGMRRDLRSLMGRRRGEGPARDR